MSPGHLRLSFLITPAGFALALIACEPSTAVAQTEACSYFGPLAENCVNLDPGDCVATGGVALGPGTACPVSSGTVGGDLNGDGTLDTLDVSPFILALIDPAAYAAAYPSGNINLADMNHDSARDGMDIPPFVSALLAGPPPCTFGRKYCHVTKSADSTTGCSAYIDTRATTLCGEPTETKPASSDAYVGVTLYSGSTPTKWAQTGYKRGRSKYPPPSTTVTFVRYAETKAGSQPSEYNFRIGDAPDTFTHKYNCHLLSSLFGTWYFEYDDELWYEFTHANWRNQRGNAYQYVAEIWNKQDQMVGTDAEKCQIYDCQYAASYGAFQNANITVSDIQTRDAAEWGIERLNSTSINVWDKHP